MKKQLVTATLTLTLALGMAAVAGCASEAPKDDLNANVPAGAPPLMPKSHAGRFEGLGAAGCYGCHGANEKANPMLSGSVALPEDHYASGQSGALELDPMHELCNTCHVQG
ncbi:MAG: hypothetical protein RRZ85_01610 [Gordonibacter sp.]|uniref:hypothetical protein n=1 Tax=Gordonibacter sp. TaxID=1968902 RepID=UPI002FC9047C